MMQRKQQMFKWYERIYRRWHKQRWKIAQSSVYYISPKPRLPVTGQHLVLFADYEYCINKDCEQLQEEIQLVIEVIEHLKNTATELTQWIKTINMDHPSFADTDDYWSHHWVFKQGIAAACNDLMHWHSNSVMSYFMMDGFLWWRNSKGPREVWFVSPKHIMESASLTNIQINRVSGITDGKEGVKHLNRHGFNVGVLNLPELMWHEWRNFLSHAIQLRMSMFSRQQTHAYSMKYFMVYWDKWIEILQEIKDILGNKPWRNRAKLFK